MFSLPLVSNYISNIPKGNVPISNRVMLPNTSVLSFHSYLEIFSIHFGKHFPSYEIFHFTGKCFPSLLGNISHLHLETFAHLLDNCSIPIDLCFLFILGKVFHSHCEIESIHIWKNSHSYWVTFPMPTNKSYVYWGNVHWETKWSVLTWLFWSSVKDESCNQN